MIRRLALVAALAALAGAAPARGHDPSKHKGKSIAGDVVSVAGDRVELKTAKGSAVVTLTEKTKFERGDHAAARTDLKPGVRVTVFGTTLATGETVAREVLLTPAAGAKPKPRAKH